MRMKTPLPCKKWNTSPMLHLAHSNLFTLSSCIILSNAVWCRQPQQFDYWFCCFQTQNWLLLTHFHRNMFALSQKSCHKNCGQMRNNALSSASRDNKTTSPAPTSPQMSVSFLDIDSTLPPRLESSTTACSRQPQRRYALGEHHALHASKPDPP